VVLLAAAGSLLGVAVEGFLVLIGIDIFVTGALGYYSLYHALGHAPKASGGPNYTIDVPISQ